MRTVLINLCCIEKVRAFVKIAETYPYDLDIEVGRYVVDAKSIMGIFSVDITKDLKLNIQGDDSHEVNEFIKSIKQFIVEQ